MPEAQIRADIWSARFVIVKVKIVAWRRCVHLAEKSMAVLLLCMGWVALAQAAQVTTTLNISATMVGSCTISATSMNFPTYDGSADVTTTSTIASNCTSGQAYMVHLDAGSHYSATSRHVADVSTGTHFVAYQLYQGTGTTPWGDAGNTGAVTNPWVSLSLTGTGLNQISTVGGTLFGGANVPPGSYSDVINITVTY
jgi:spore coat protein U-like protein